MSCHRAPRWFPALAIALALMGPAEVSALTVCSVGTGGSGRYLDTGTGGTGIHDHRTGLSSGTGTGGTGIDTGQGGTGQRADVGIGGTGIDTGTGGTGIVGVITGFGSICVNGIEVEFDARTPVSENGARGSPDNLKIGQVVEVLANGNGERVMARQIHVRDAIVGPVTRVDPRTGRVEVMNQPVRWESATVPGRMGVTPLRISDVRPGQFLRVSGFRTETGEVIASRIDTAPAGDVRLTGRPTEASGARIRIQGVSVEMPPGQRFETGAIDTHAEVAVTGLWQDGTIRATRVDPDDTGRFAGRAEFVSVQGSIGEKTGDGSFRIGSTRVKLNAGTQIDDASRVALRDGAVVQVEGRIGRDDSIEAERVYAGDRLPRPDDRERGRHGGGDLQGEGSSSSGGDDQDPVRADNPDPTGRREGDDSGSRSGGRSDSDRTGNAERSDRDGIDSSGRAERDRPERAEKIERERVEKLDKAQRDRIERSEKLERDAAKEREKIEHNRN